MAKAPNGRGTHTPDGYRLLTVNGKRKLEHVHVAEQALGKPLPAGAVVHHINGIRDDNRNENLLICPDHVYHRLIHKRENALDASGHAGWLKCRHCGKHDDPKNMYVHPNGRIGRHVECLNAYARELAARKRVIQSEGVM